MNTVRHSKQDALSERQFERLLATTYTLDGYWELESRFVILVAGRLGLRAGEIVHMKDEWIDWSQRRIEIPRHQTCDMGRDGGPCATCRRLAEQKMKIVINNQINEIYENLQDNAVLEPGGGKVHQMNILPRSERVSASE